MNRRSTHVDVNQDPHGYFTLVRRLAVAALVLAALNLATLAWAFAIAAARP